jgi:hypothetical protein
MQSTLIRSSVGRAGRAVILLVAALSMVGGGALAAAAATPAYASACQGAHPPPSCGGDDPKPPPPPAAANLVSSGLVNRDVNMYPGAPYTTVQTGYSEAYTVSALRGNVGTTSVRLVGQRTVICPTANGQSTTATTPIDSGFVSSVASYAPSTAAPCPGARSAFTALSLHAEARDANGGFSQTNQVVFQYNSNPTTSSPVAVHEGDRDVATGLWVLPGDWVTVTAAGGIWAGYIFDGYINGPDGDFGGSAVKVDPDWYVPNHYGSCPYAAFYYSDAKYCTAGAGYPLPDGAPKFSLLYRLDGGYHFAGSGIQIGGYTGQPVQLVLRINDDVPGNGTGQFDVNVSITRTR